IPWVQAAVRDSMRGESWEKRLAQVLLTDIGRAHRTVTHRVLDCDLHGGDLHRCIDDIDNHHSRETSLYHELIGELRGEEKPPLSGLAVATRALAEIAIPRENL